MFVIFLILTYFINWGVRYKIEESRFISDAQSIFWQIDQIIVGNDEGVAEIITDFSNQCLTNAQTVAYMAEANPALYSDIDELKKMADLIGVDEIHFFDTEGLLYFGTHPEYYGYSFTSGNQMQFFLPMLEDTSLMLCQDITPNTAESKPMQYAAVWNESGTGIVQIGVTPDRVLAAQEGNDISDVFDMMPISDGQIFFAIDPTTFEIVGSTSEEMVGQSVTTLGVVPNDADLIYALTDSTPGQYTSNGETYLYLVHQADELIIANLYDKDVIMASVTTDSIIVSLYILLFAVVSVIFITVYLNRKIIRSIITINRRLELIERGDLSIIISQHTVPELSALSNHINSMVQSLINQARKLSIALDLAQIPTGIVEYSTTTKQITATSEVQEILHLSPQEYEQTFTDADTLVAKLEEIALANSTSEENVLHFKETNTYVKMEQFQYEDSALVLVMDVSKEFKEKERIKYERDTDILTNLYNRRAFYYNADQILSNATTPYIAVCVIDLDNLKHVNDFYGHEMGDLYIKRIADLIRFDCDYIAGRLGGDEFAALLYNAPNEDVLRECIATFQNTQDLHSIHLPDGRSIPLAFSVGYALAPTDMREGAESQDFTYLIKLADDRMYKNKSIRKGGKPCRRSEE